MNLATEAGLLNVGLSDVCYTAGLTGESNGITKSQSTVTEFIADEEAASVCPLLSPSPPTDFEHPLSLPSAMGYEHQISPSSTDPELSALPTINGSAVQPLESSRSAEASAEVFNPASMMESSASSSSGSSVLHETTACAQLLSSHHYQHLTKADADPFTLQENGGKPVLTGIQLAVRKSTEDYCFLDWNWPLIRKVSFWTVMSSLMVCVCAVVTMIAQLPSRCDPPHAWWQGTLFYEIFVPSFQDSNSDGVGDLQGLQHRVDYLESLGVRAVRLNSIFSVDPDHCIDIKNLTQFHRSLGTMDDFHSTVRTLHSRNISVILDLPLLIERADNCNISNALTAREARIHKNMISDALNFWLSAGVDGFYLKGLECLANHSDFIQNIREWRTIIDKYNQDIHNQKILMCSENVLHASVEDDVEYGYMNVVLSRMDLIDFHLDLYTNGTEGIKNSVYRSLKSRLYEKPGYPWIHWNVGNIETQRLSAHSGSAEGNLAAILFNLMLPGTPSIFYGDEIGLQDVLTPKDEHRENPRSLPLTPMHWNASEKGFGFTSKIVHPWLSPSTSLNSVSHGHQDIIHSVAMFRESSPSIYMNGVIKEGMKMPNCEIRDLDEDIIVIQRWYPRRHSYVMVTNLGNHNCIRDLSSWLYGGEIVVDQRSRTGQYVKFDSLELNARESLIVKLDK